MSDEAMNELLDALEAAHRDTDLLLAQLATLQRDFFPSRSPVWPNVVARHELLQRYGRHS
jgi:hypothetical protein